MSDGPAEQPDEPSTDEPPTTRSPITGPSTAGSPPSGRPRIIRRHPTGAFPRLGPAADTGGEPPTSLIPGAAEPQTNFIPQAAPMPTGPLPHGPVPDVSVPAAAAPAPAPPPIDRPAGPGTTVAAAVVTILSGWAIAVIATDLITGWWASDRLFCVAVGFLTAVSAAAMVGGMILMLLRRRMGRLLTVVGSAIGLLIFGSLFVAGAALPPVVYAIPVLPLTSIVLTVLPATGRWARFS